MPQTKRHPDNAARQRAYRARLKATSAPKPAKTEKSERPGRPPSKAQLDANSGGGRAVAGRGMRSLSGRAAVRRLPPPVSAGPVAPPASSPWC